MISFSEFEIIAKIESDSKFVKLAYKEKKNQFEHSEINIGTKAAKLSKSLLDDENKVFIFVINLF